jgi:hypothetical protein
VAAEPRERDPASAPESQPAPVLPQPPEQHEPLKQRRVLGPLEEVPPAVPELSEPTPAPTSAVAPAGPPEWHRLAQTGELGAARVALDRQGGFDAALPTASPDQLMSLADIARDAGQSGRAIQALKAVVGKYPKDPVAPLAALTLGRLLEKVDPAGAAQALALYRSLSPKGEFAEDALARQVEVAVEQGNVELARQLADQYGKEFPNGRRLREIRAQIAKLTGEPAAAMGASGSQPPADDEAPSDEPDEAPPAAP